MDIFHLVTVTFEPHLDMVRVNKQAKHLSQSSFSSTVSRHTHTDTHRADCSMWTTKGRYELPVSMTRSAPYIRVHFLTPVHTGIENAPVQTARLYRPYVRVGRIGLKWLVTMKLQQSFHRSVSVGRLTNVRLHATLLGVEQILNGDGHVKQSRLEQPQ